MNMALFRRGSGQGRRRAGLVVLLIAAVAVLGIAAAAILARRDPAPTSSGELLVVAIAVHCNWRFDYPVAGVSARELVLPVGRPVLLRVTSRDAAHTFSVPELGLTGEVLPGRWTTLRLSPAEIGDYQLLGRDPCPGATVPISATLRVVEPMALQSWLAMHPARDSLAVPASPQDRGRQLTETNGCLGCHSVDGSDLVAPTWRGLYGASRRLADGSTVLAGDDYLTTAILDPGAQVVAGFADIMPPAYTMLSAEDVQAMIAYIASLD